MHEAQALARSRMHLIRNPAGTGEQLPTIERKGARLTLWIYGPIGTGTLTAESLCDALSTHSDAAGVYLRIASAGGYAEQGLAVAEAIMRHPGRSIAIVDRFAYSGASAIASAANRVLIRRSATWMAHHCWQNVTGDADALNSYAGAMRSTDLRMSALYARRRRISPADCHRLLASGRYLTADEAVAAGVCDDVLGDLPYLMESFT
jgi:ATP-dependent protease ClpP protease subunit